ncbi:MAG TPA: hypothetical protein VET24_05555 [Actinomycetota bacterium]|nr:hypothetical protein [Actinomycetota bacterium]
MNSGTSTRTAMGKAASALVAGCAAGAFLLIALGPAARAEVPAGGAFSGTASADGIRVGLSVPNFLIIENFVDGGGPSAQATLDSLGTSKAFASLPYPGETGVALPGLVGTLTGKSIPGFPFYVATANPTTPDSHADQPGYHLASHSDASSSAASAQAGETTTTGIETGAFSTATVSAGRDGGVVAESDTRIDIALGVIRLSGLESTASVIRDAAGLATRRSSLKVGALALGGITVGVTDQGLVLGGLTLPLGNLLGGLSKVLSLGDTTVKFLPAAETEDSVLSAGLLITTSEQLPVVGHPAQVSITVGRAFAMAAASALPEPPAAALGSGTEPDHGAVAGPATISPPALDGEALSGAPGPPAPVPLPVAAPPARPVTVVRRLPMTVSSLTLYPIVVLAAVGVLASSLAYRMRKKERWAWSS